MLYCEDIGLFAALFRKQLGIMDMNLLSQIMVVSPTSKTHRTSGNDILPDKFRPDLHINYG